jgi:tight adherence protein C
MQLLQNFPLLAVMGMVFVGVLALILLLDRPGRASRAGARLEDYINASPSEMSIQSEASRRREQASGLERLLSYAAVAAPQKLRASAANDLARARVNMSVNVFLGIRGVLPVGVLVLGLLWIVSSPQSGAMQWLLVGVLAIVAPRLPKMWLQRHVSTNARAIQRALPYAIDLLVACLEGGLSLEAALDRVASETDTLLSEEIQRTLAEIALGRSSADALRDLASRAGVPDLKRLTETVLQADRMGVSIAEAMRTLADESRTRRRQRAEEEARKAPIKMLPVVVCTTLPAIGAVVLTPALLNLSRALAVFAHK